MPVMNISTALIVFNMLFDQPNKKHVLIWHQRDRSISRRFIVREKKNKKKNVWTVFYQVKQKHLLFR